MNTLISLHCTDEMGWLVGGWGWTGGDTEDEVSVDSGGPGSLFLTQGIQFSLSKLKFSRLLNGVEY